MGRGMVEDFAGEESKYVNHSKVLRAFPEEEEREVSRPSTNTLQHLHVQSIEVYYHARIRAHWTVSLLINIRRHTGGFIHVHHLYFQKCCISKAVFIWLNNEADVQKIKDSDKWIKNRLYSAL